MKKLDNCLEMSLTPKFILIHRPEHNSTCVLRTSQHVINLTRAVSLISRERGTRAAGENRLIPEVLAGFNEVPVAWVTGTW